MRSKTPLPVREPGHLVPFLEAAALFAALCIFARSAVLVLAAFIAAPLPRRKQCRCRPAASRTISCRFWARTPARRMPEP